jgi:hypothetical protein
MYSSPLTPTTGCKRRSHRPGCASEDKRLHFIDKEAQRTFLVRTNHVPRQNAALPSLNELLQAGGNMIGCTGGGEGFDQFVAHLARACGNALEARTRLGQQVEPRPMCGALASTIAWLRTGCSPVAVARQHFWTVLIDWPVAPGV